MFEVVGQDIISGNMGFIGTDPDRLYRMGAAEKTEDVTVTGNPAVLDNATGKPFKDLHIYGRSEQMTTTGAQLIDINSFQKNNDISVKIVNNYSIELTSTIKKDASDSSRVYLNATIDADILVGKTITMSYDGWNSNVPNEVAVYGIMYNINGKNNYESILSDSRIKTVTIPLGAKDCKVRLFLVENASATVKAGTYTAIIKGLMICEGTVAKSWEPYTGGKPSPSPDYPQEIQSAGDDGNLSVIVKNPDNEQMQSVSFSTPNGLPGIPVSANGNYTDSNGQQWVCDEVDLERGVNVQRVKVKELSADDKWTYRKLDSGNNNFQTRIYGGDSAKNSFPTICDILPYKNTIWNDDSKNLPKIYANNNEITISFPPSSEYSSLETFKQLLTNAKSFVFYCLATPIETTLAASEIAAYKSLRTYRGTTIVEAEDKAGVSVTYKRNAKAAEKEVNILHADLMAEMEELDENSEIV